MAFSTRQDDKKTIYFLRHGLVDHKTDEEGVHRDHDPMLNHEGIKQAEQARVQLRDAKLPIEIIFCSPLRRAIETMQIAFQDYIFEDHLPVKILPTLQDCGDWECNVGSPVPELEQQFPRFDFSACYEDKVYPRKEGIHKADFETSVKKTEQLAEYFARIPQKSFAVVTHGVCIRLFCGFQKPGEMLNATPKDENSFSAGQHGGYTFHYYSDKTWRFTPLEEKK
ncbi:phosphoglycerate mutase family protein [Schizosaccharomyces octosporus yFS286]|uniref:Phosphoglycerate mutase family protein n=1 Tax=Schizosaccharomyces octosporus (strain yFS286) TaxID=483514 RepID=S9PVH5_SCHOY|nr:phosphoglycerate mutase family protein [Schizosaccharomyces octosporus yFS286]EPX71488.1 phosphoglycerate mutase family protein [Schizosaccharomyces octosporus yFS286]